MNFTRRSLITTLTATGTMALTGCSSSSSTKTSTTGPSGSVSGTTAAAAAINPVKGFSTPPVWAQPERSGTPLNAVGAAWSQGHAWFCMQVTESQFVINAYDPTSKKLITSPAQNGDLTGAQLYPVVSPSEGLIVRATDGTSGCITLNGSTMTIKKASDPTGTDTKPQWMGDALFVAPYVKAMDSDPTNTEPDKPAYVLDVTKGSWVTVTPKNPGMSVAGLTRVNGQPQNVEITADRWATANHIKIGSHTGNLTGTVIFALGGKIVTVSTHNGTTLTPLDENLKSPTAGSWAMPSTISTPHPSVIALSADRLSAIMPDGQRYDAVKNTVTTGVCTDNMLPQWALINAAITSSALYANSNPDSGSVQDPSPGAFVGTSTIPATPDTKTQAPALVMPDGSGLFSTATGWVVLPATH